MKFREAYARGVPLVHYDRFGPGAAAYRAAAEAFLDAARRPSSRRVAGRASPAGDGVGERPRLVNRARRPRPKLPGGASDERDDEAGSRARRAGPGWSGRR